MEHEVYEHNLAGGAKGLVVHVPGSQVVNLVIAFNSGYQFGDFAKYEIPHVLEHLIGTATTHYPEHTALKIELQKNGLYRNAHTSSESNWYDFEFASFELDRILGLLEEHFLETQLPEAMVQIELGNVRQELTRNSAQPEYICGIAHLAAAYPKQNMVTEQRLKQLASITPADLADYRKRTYTRANMRFYLAGNFPDQGKVAVEQIGQALTRLPRGRRLKLDMAPAQSYAAQAIKREIKQIYYYVNWSNGPLARDLWPATSILSSLLGQGYGSRILGEARHRGLAYDVMVSCGFTPESSGLSVRSNVTPDNIEPLFSLIAEQVQDIKRGKVTAQEIEATKNLRVGSRIRATQTDGQLLGWYMGEYEDREEIEDWSGWNDKLRAVTREQVIEVAQQITTGANHGATFVGPVTKLQAQRFAKLLEPVSE